MSSSVTGAVVIGSGPNGLSAAIVCARAGLEVTVCEAEPAIGGGARTDALTLPGFLHDRCASVFPLGIASPFFRALPIEAHGLSWVHARYPLAHPLDGGHAIVVDRSLEATAGGLGRDGPTYGRLLAPFVRHWTALMDDVLGPVRPPRHPVLMARFGLNALLPATRLARRFESTPARALLAGLAAHSGEPLGAPLTSSFALLLGALAHAVGWPVAGGGAQAIPSSLASCLQSYGGRIETRRRIATLDELPPSALIVADLAPESLAGIAGERLPRSFRQHLTRFRRTAAAFKLDWALDGPIPWKAVACREAATVHVGGTLEEIAASERSAHDGTPCDRPFLIVAQPSACDPARAPAGRHAAWGYCHVPLGSSLDWTPAIEAQIERFAPGFRDRILARHVSTPADLERGNANLIGGDISGGAYTPRQMLARPSWRGYATPNPRLFLCSASTLPGAGVHGMCGYWAARTALRRLRR
jgi:phytoene dehydrogenase-like protein